MHIQLEYSIFINTDNYDDHLFNAIKGSANESWIINNNEIVMENNCKIYLWKV